MFLLTVSGNKSTNVQRPLPRDRHSIPRLPEPQYRSRMFFPSISILVERRLKSVSLALSVVGLRFATDFGTVMVLLLRYPEITLIVRVRIMA